MLTSSHIHPLLLKNCESAYESISQSSDQLIAFREQFLLCRAQFLNVPLVNKCCLKHKQDCSKVVYMVGRLVKITLVQQRESDIVLLEHQLRSYSVHVIGRSLHLCAHLEVLRSAVRRN